MTIELQNISKTIEGRSILRNINWNISSDDIWALTGPEGSGKTMLFRLILGLEKPDSGSVNLLGDYKYSRVNAGVVFQEDRLCEQFSATENVAMVNERLSETVAREDLLHFLPEECLGKDVSLLDQVQRRLVVIVRACIIPSDLLLLDEPFRGMDEELRGKALSYIRDKAGHKGIVIAQRTMEGLEFCRKFELS